MSGVPNTRVTSGCQRGEHSKQSEQAGHHKQRTAGVLCLCCQNWSECCVQHKSDRRLSEGPAQRAKRASWSRVSLLTHKGEQGLCVSVVVKSGVSVVSNTSGQRSGGSKQAGPRFHSSHTKKSRGSVSVSLSKVN